VLSNSSFAFPSTRSPFIISNRCGIVSLDFTNSSSAASPVPLHEVFSLKYRFSRVNTCELLIDGRHARGLNHVADHLLRAHRVSGNTASRLLVLVGDLERRRAVEAERLG